MKTRSRLILSGIVLISSLLLLVQYSCTEPVLEYQLGAGITAPTEAAEFPKPSSADILLGKLNPNRSCYDVIHYDLSVTVKPDQKSISGENIITARSSGCDSIQIDLYSNLKVEGIYQQDTELKYHRQHGAIFLKPKLTSADSIFQITIKYSGRPHVAVDPPWDGGFIWEQDTLGRPWIGVACEGDGASLWWPCKDHPSDEPDSMDIHITVRDSLLVVSNGQHRGDELQDGWRTSHWHLHNPINTYNVTFNIGKYVPVTDTLICGQTVHTLNHYALDFHQEVAKNYFQQARQVIHVFEKLYGPYPFWEDGYRLVETPYAGMEHQSCIAYGNGFKMDHEGIYHTYLEVDYIILHETAHEWWGNSITARDGAEIWLHEAFATYSEALYIEEILGPRIYQEYINNRRRISNNRPIVGPLDQNYWSFEDAYFKGAWVLHTLRSVLNDDELFFRILKGFATEYAYQIVETVDFINYVNLKTGDNFRTFFQQYLYFRLPPTLLYHQDEAGFHYRWTNTVQDFTMPLDIYVNKQKVRVVPSEEWQVLPVPRLAIIEVDTRRFYVGLVAEDPG